ncbi:MAG: hypothetical protein K8F30_11795 [Taibaiella sp.]|nr:hypothetical protein [Taibaiella sp.]
MPLSLNEIKKRAVAFSKEWENETSEDAEAKSFWDGFFNVFGIPRRRVAMFEKQVEKLDHRQGYIDLLWKGKLLVEHKSKGKNLERAYKQARDYFPGLKDEELPRYILVCDFQDFRLYDLDEDKDYSFTLNKLVDNIRLFDFISGHVHHRIREQDPVNIKAAEMMGRLHDKLKEIGYTGHELELYLVRLVFCLFADDTNIFEQGIFYDLLDQRTKEDGSDLAGWLAQLFDVLDTPVEKRLRNLDENLAEFPYVNGKLFSERIRTASFDSEMRQMLIQSCALDWSAISPAIFGSLFQSVMNPEQRRNLGAHYTSEENILKLIKPLFLDELYDEFNKVKGNSAQLDRFHAKLAELRFLDPACGCGNFLIVAYRELRLLEIEILKTRFKNQIATNIDLYVLVNVDQFYGIEYEEFPAQIAQVAMWLIDHQMNRMVSDAFGDYYRRLPLTKSATIVQGNALRIDWQSLLIKDSSIDIHADKANIILQEPERTYKTVNVYANEVNFVKKGDVTPATPLQYNYILGNPPFIGSKLMNEQQRAEVVSLFDKTSGAGVLDYVTAWYVLAAKYMQRYNHGDTKTKSAFVSTNSISQGEQVGILWNELFNNYHVKIHFAHRTFKWSNEARGKAAVYVVIIGFANFDVSNRKIYYYEDVKGKHNQVLVKNINPYLVEGNEVVILRRQNPICNVPNMSFGNMPLDGGHLLLSDTEKVSLLEQEPKAGKFIKRLIGAREFLNNENRWCLWLVEASPSELREMPHVLERVKAVKKFREGSIAPSTRKFAAMPTLFRDRQTPDTYIVIPSVSSERRPYIPIGFFSKDVITTNLCLIIPEASYYHFGVLSSTMHMAWVRYTCGRLESRYRYSKDIVYNNYPWPENPSEKQKKTVEDAAQEVLDARAQYPDASLADLYDPNTMPPALVKAHQKLDKAVDLCYRPQPFPDETRRIEYLFDRYDKYTAGLFKEEKKKKKK